ncbi:hypothetical protein L227DRAFT_573059 [Lentinus tigrinus ALCF2SS1-6]|uniref:Uncharacterized protein n=1 Tax=Lentinus tigrinus ALCF2SS1-6 TaxID=1328759 RepID=A0A5C2SI21_9APHY|nr:hypothetical protein L227DRAFT_573059 [Lentinus tigrinus ALCF2SS1-6]
MSPSGSSEPSSITHRNQNPRSVSNRRSAFPYPHASIVFSRGPCKSSPWCPSLIWSSTTPFYTLLLRMEEIPYQKLGHEPMISTWPRGLGRHLLEASHMVPSRLSIPPLDTDTLRQHSGTLGRRSKGLASILLCSGPLFAVLVPFPVTVSVGFVGICRRLCMRMRAFNGAFGLNVT